jgi:membrane associated rhomboid family serine protease
MRPVRLGSVVLPPITFTILVVLVGCFIASGLMANFGPPGVAAALSYLPVTTAGVLHGEVWRLLTYALLHNLSDPFHLIFNGMAIFFFGRALEDRWGVGRYLLFLLLTVVVGGAFVVGAGWLGVGNGAAYGASAFAEGLVVGWGLLYRDAPVRLYFAIPVKGIHMVWLAVFIWVLDAVSQSPNSAAAHLGGMLTAATLVLGVWRPNHVKAWFAGLREKVGGKKQPQLFVVPKPRAPDKKWVN